MIALGVPIKAVQERLGHSRPDVLLNGSGANSGIPSRTVVF